MATPDYLKRLPVFRLTAFALWSILRHGMTRQDAVVAALERYAPELLTDAGKRAIRDALTARP